MKEYIEERAVAMQLHLDYNATVRQAARKFGISKSTVHKDVARAPFPISIRRLHPGARVVLDINKAERHIRGGDGDERKNMSMSTSCARAGPGREIEKRGKIGS